MSLDTTVLLRALCEQGIEHDSDLADVWEESAHQASALLLVIEKDGFTPTKTAEVLAIDALAMGGLSDLAEFVYSVGGQQAVFDLAKETWVEREYGRLKWRECEPCETESPVDPDDKKSCLVCGSPVR